jgi:methylamine---glutamate N-methyltransferase subunit C
MDINTPRTPPRKSATFDDYTLAEIRRAATTGIYDIRGGGAKRKLPHFDDLLFLGASISRYPLEGYREKCGTDVGARHALRQEADRAQDPDHHRRHELRLAVGPGQGSAGPRRHHAGTSTTTGDGGMTPEERGQSKISSTSICRRATA